MNASPPTRNRAGFTLIEVLAAIGLCAVLAAAAAAAIRLSSRAARLADRAGDASLLVPALYAAQRVAGSDTTAIEFARSQVLGMVEQEDAVLAGLRGALAS